MRKDALDYISAIKKELTSQGIEVREGAELLEPGELVTRDIPDLVVITSNGKMLLVEVKDAKTYGKLPLSTASEMKSFKETNPDSGVLLISLSTIPPILSESLKTIGINFLEKPSIKEAARMIAGTGGRYSMSA